MRPLTASFPGEGGNSTITGERKQPHNISQDNCIKCGVCLDSCRQGAVLVA